MKTPDHLTCEDVESAEKPSKACEFCGEPLHQGYLYYNNISSEPGYIHSNPDAAERCFSSRFSPDIKP